MSFVGVTISTKADSYALRVATPDDDRFLYGLFCAEKAADLALTGLPPVQIDALLAMQHQGQAMTYAAAFPDARSWIVEQDGRPIARLLEADAEANMHIVDVSVALQQRRQGIGRALIRRLQVEAARQGCGVTAQILLGNMPSRALFRSLGFVETVTPGEAYLGAAWRAEKAM